MTKPRIEVIMLRNRFLDSMSLLSVGVLLAGILACGGGGGGSSTGTPPTATTPKITAQPASRIVTNGQSVTFTVIAAGTARLRYQWQRGVTKVGSDSESLLIPSARAEDAGSYTVTISNDVGSITSNAATLVVNPAELVGDFTFAVWLQSPVRTRNGKNNAQNYQAIGINTFVGLWRWPAEDWAYSGYSMLVAKVLQDAGMKAYAGNGEIPEPIDPKKPNTQTAIDWNVAHPEYASTFVGYILGDEPDMNKWNAEPTVMPDYWKAKGEAVHNADPSREIYTNFGKGFALDPWAGYHVNPGPTQFDDFQKYVSPNTVISSDYYGITDPWEPADQHGIWTYGRAVANTKKYAGSRPVWGIVEASAPWSDSENAGNRHQMYRKMPPSLVMPIVWNMVIRGASGILYFCHDFSSDGLGEDAALAEPGMPAAMAAANASVRAYGAVLHSPDIPGTTVTTGDSVNVITLTKNFNGSTYIFAMADGSASYNSGKAVDAQIQVSGTRSGSVEVLNNVRTITMTNGKFSDHFGPYELHIYKY